MRELDKYDVISRLRAEVKRAGSVAAWAERHNIPRTAVSKSLSHSRPPSEAIISALGLRMIIVSDSD
jgi:DNA-binding phage protein